MYVEKDEVGIVLPDKVDALDAVLALGYNFDITHIFQQEGKFVAGKRPDADKPRSRPVDPNEAMAGTVVGFELLDPGDAEYDEAMPVPQPKPREPRSYEREAAGMLNEISSNTWDSTHKDEANQLRVKKSFICSSGACATCCCTQS